MTEVHPTAIVDSRAELGVDVEIGPMVVIGPDVSLGDGTKVGSHVVLDGHLTLGANCRIYPHAVLGTPPQDIKYADQPTRVEFGDRNLIREFVTVHRGTPQGGGLTKIGSDVFLMAYSHVAHDNMLDDHVIVANNVQLAGHVHVGKHAIIGGCSAVHQYVRIGQHAFVGGGSIVVMDVPPFCNATGNRAKLHGVNSIGLSRRGFTDKELKAVRGAYRLAFQSNLLVDEAIGRIEKEMLPDCAALVDLTSFLLSSKRGVTR